MPTLTFEPRSQWTPIVLMEYGVTPDAVLDFTPKEWHDFCEAHRQKVAKTKP